MLSRSLLLLAIVTGAQAADDALTQKPAVQPVNVPGEKPKPENFNVLPGFQVEKLFTVPRDKMGSWVCLTVDPKGRIIASDQGDKGLYRITPGTADADTKVEKLPIKLTAAQGLLFAFGHLYVCCNGGPGSGLYRVKYDSSKDEYGAVEKLKEFRGGGEHGPHALRLTPDGKGIFVSCGNHTLPPDKFDHSRLPRNWSEDHILPRQWDANGHARGILAPGGWIARTDPDGKTWEIFTAGYRNQYDFALNAEGEMFVYDADMEWDVGTPWYRPTRVNHATSGSELGWRSGTGKWPSYYVDSLPAAVDIGPGSPVGVEFGYGAKFPAKYQKALYILDWTFGTIYAIHLTPHLSTYKAVKEEFVSRTPLPLTDAVVSTDGALYFAIGGRNAQSELFRVTYVGKDSTEPAIYRDAEFSVNREKRRRIEELHKPAQNPEAVSKGLIEHLSDPDRFIRYAARVALEHQPATTWEDAILKATHPDTLITGAVAIAHQSNKARQGELLAALNKLDFAKLELRQQLDLLRAYALVFLRMGEPDKTTASTVATKLDPFYPSSSDDLNRELCQLLVYLKSPTVIEKTTQLLKLPSKPSPNPGLHDLLARNKGYATAIEAMIRNGADQQKFSYLFSLRNAKEGWTMEQRKVYFASVNEARSKSGGNSYQGFLNNMEREAFDNASEADRLAIEAAGLRKPFKPKELPKPVGPGKDWTTADVMALQDKLTNRSFSNGQKMFGAARCVVCHRFYGEGGATGPDLTQSAGRFGFKDMAEAILEPNKVISDQYKASVVTTLSGKKYTGKLLVDNPQGVQILTDPEDSTKLVEIKRADVEEVKPSAISLMPADLLKPLNEEEVKDLMAYLLSRGDPTNAMFRPEPKKKAEPKKKNKQE